MRILLLPIAFFYQIVLKVRHKLYDWKLLESTRFDMPVICMGNLSLGGTGKTPHTEHLIRLLKDEYRVSVLSRGYGRSTKGFLLAEASSSYHDLGDEPMQYHTKFPAIQVAVDEDRVEGVKRLQALSNPPEVILLDDAFQHRSLEAGLNILLTEYGRLYADDFLVPAGTLRDLRSAAKRADLIVVSKSPKDLDEETKAMILAKLKPEAHQKVFFSHLEYQALRPLNKTAEGVVSETADNVLVFSGIANPKPVIETLKKRFRHVELLAFRDHHPYSASDIETIVKRFKNLEGNKKIVITTEKDEARIKKSPYICKFDSIPLYVAPVNVRFNEEEKYHEEIIRYVRKSAQNR